MKVQTPKKIKNRLKTLTLNKMGKMKKIMSQKARQKMRHSKRVKKLNQILKNLLLKSKRNLLSKEEGQQAQEGEKMRKRQEIFF
jgi:hypothetical protein